MEEFVYLVEKSGVVTNEKIFAYKAPLITTKAKLKYSAGCCELFLKSYEITFRGSPLIWERNSR